MARPALWPQDTLLVLRFLVMVLPERERVWRGNFRKTVKKRRPGLRGFPLFSPRGRLGSAEAEPSLSCSVIVTSSPIDRQALCKELPRSLSCLLGEKVARELP